MDHSPLSGARKEYPLAAYQLRVGQSVRSTAATLGESRVNRCVQKGRDGPMAGKFLERCSGSRKFKLHTQIDLPRNRILHPKMN